MHYLVENILVSGDEKVIPFRIALPHDCKKVVGFSVVTDAMLRTVVDDYIANTLFGTFEQALAEMTSSMKRKGDIPTVMRFSTEYNGSPAEYPPINLLKHKLAKVNLKTLKDIVGFETVLPMRFKLVFRNLDNARDETQLLTLPQISAIEDRFQPVSVSGVKEIAGWAELTETGQMVQTSETPALDMASGQDYLLPYFITITLKYERG